MSASGKSNHRANEAYAGEQPVQLSSFCSKASLACKARNLTITIEILWILLTL